MVNLNPANQASVNLSGVSSQSLSAQLSQAFAETLQQFGIDPSSVKMTIQSNSGQTSSATSATQTGQSTPAPSSQTTGASQNSATAATKTALGFSALAQTGASSTPTTTATSSVPSTHWYADDPTDDAYWSQQPPAVQQLREIQDESQRQALGTQLASQGYQIDVPIMIWGYDAGQTMAMRQQMGYTWVPSASQNPVESAPGISVPGFTPYDPNNPPTGSITVG